MGQYLLRRALQSVLVLLGVSVVVFLMLRASGDPAALMVPTEASQEQYAAMREQLGLNEALPLQYLRFITAAVRGDFGSSIRADQPALGLVTERLPATALLAGTALVLAVSVALPAGVLIARRRHRVTTSVVTVLALVGQSAPVFWVGVMLILLFAVTLRWLPSGGSGTLAHLLLPAVTLALPSMARTTRMVRSGILEVQAEDFVRTARAKGLSERTILRGHVLRNMLLPVVTVIGLDIGVLIGGAVITETVFGWPGVGRLVLQAIQTRDFPVVQAAVFVIASSYVVINLAIDALYAYLDPRIRFR